MSCSKGSADGGHLSLMGWSAFGPRKAPPRYPLVGFAFIGGFLLLSVGLGGIRGKMKALLDVLPSEVAAPSVEAEEKEALPDNLTPSVKVALRMAQEVLPQFGCLEREANPRDCNRVLDPAADQLDSVVSALRIQPLSQLNPQTRRFTDQMDGLAQRTHAFAQGRSPEQGSALVASAHQLYDLLEIALPVHNGSPPWVPVVSDGGGEALDGSSPEADASTPGQVAAVVASDAGEFANLEPTGDAGEVGADAPDGGVVAPPSLTQQLAKPLHDALTSLESANHARNLAADAAWRARTRLDALPPLLRQYQAVERTGEAQESATAFSQDVDRARGRLLRVAAELERAVSAPVDSLEGTFEAVDAALAKARLDVAAVDAKLDASP